MDLVSSRSLEEAARLGTAPSSALSQRSLCPSPRSITCVVGVASLILPTLEGSGSSGCFTRDEQRVVSGCCGTRACVSPGTSSGWSLAAVGLGLGLRHHIRWPVQVGIIVFCLLAEAAVMPWGSCLCQGQSISSCAHLSCWSAFPYDDVLN